MLFYIYITLLNITIKEIKMLNFKKFISILFLIIIIFFIILFFNNKYQKNSLIDLSIDEFNNIKSPNEITLIYLGRDSCNQCIEFKPMLEKFLIENNKFAYYVNFDISSDDFEMNNKKNQIIKKYNIISVPSILILENDDYYIITDKDNNMIIKQLAEI